MERHCGEILRNIRSWWFPYASINKYVTSRAQLTHITLLYNLHEKLQLKPPTSHDDVCLPSCEPFICWRICMLCKENTWQRPTNHRKHLWTPPKSYKVLRSPTKLCKVYEHMRITSDVCVTPSHTFAHTFAHLCAPSCTFTVHPPSWGLMGI
jgi:hypothetical protein